MAIPLGFLGTMKFYFESENIFGLYLPNNNELPTTVAELKAIAPAAKNGR